LDVVGYDCNGNPVIREHSENAISGRGGMNAALDRATESVAAALARSGHAASLIPKGLPAAT
ncbi:MAG TPA: hypothetical protein VKG44_09225, partial [Candidatus Baltobacteraceae bacterium]|nr:hypothetical protein [Candidatus Baltobacteraceae bacterium]